MLIDVLLALYIFGFLTVYIGTWLASDDEERDSVWHVFTFVGAVFNPITIITALFATWSERHHVDNHKDI